MSDTNTDRIIGRRTTPGPGRIGPRVDPSGFDRAEQNRFRTLSGLQSDPGRVGRGVVGYYDSMRYGLGRPAPGDVDSFIRANYPYLAAFLSNPEIGPLLRKGALEGWDEARLYGAVQATDWWRNTSASQRTWQMLVAEDPAEAAKLAGQTAANVQNRARALGLNLSSGTLQSIATTATANGWTDNQLVDELLRNVNWSQIAGGDLTALRDTIKQIGADFLVDVSDTTAQGYAVAIASGEMSEAGVMSVMQRQARQRFSWMADEIDQGVTPAGFFAPLRDTVARELGLAPEDVNMMDPQWMGMLEVAGDDGKTRAATIREAQLAARRDPRFADTSHGQDLLAQAAAGIRDAMGRRSI